MSQLETKQHEVRSIAVAAPAARVFALVSDPTRLPDWAHAFVRADDRGATLRTPRGSVEIGLETRADRGTGSVDWRLAFPDGSVGLAHSRVVPLGERDSAYIFVLHPPPVPLEELEGALSAQAAILEQELVTMKRLAEAG